MVAVKKATGKNKNSIRHQSGSDDYGTGRAFIDIARAVLGKITVDPFSSAKWNAVIGAEVIITQRQDGFKTPWFVDAPAPLDVCEWAERTFDLEPDRANYGLRTASVNPPGDRTGENVKRAYWATTRYWSTGWINGGAFWFGFNLNSLQTCQRADVEGVRAPSPLDPRFLRCIPDHRVPYQDRPGHDADQPTHPSWFMLLPAREPGICSRQRDAFKTLASRLGSVF